MIDPAKLFLEKINNSGWIEKTSFKEIFSVVSGEDFLQRIDYPCLFGDYVANVEIVIIDGKSSLKFDQEQEFQEDDGQGILNYMFPFVTKTFLRKSPGTFMIGSSVGNHFIIPDHTVAKKHASITKKRHGYYLKDLDSDFGSYVNGVNFGDKEVLLNDGDKLSFGRYQFRFLEAKTLYEHLFGKIKKKSVSSSGASPAEPITEEVLKTKLSENSQYVANCIVKRDFRDIEDKLLAILSFIPFFNSFTSYEKRQIVSFHQKLIMAAPEEAIVREGDVCNNFFIILKGKVRIVKSESPIALNILGPGNSFGEMAFLMGLPRSAGVVAQESTIMFTIDRDFYENIGIEIREKIKDQIIRQISANIIRQNREITEFNREHRLPISRLPRKTGHYVNHLEKNAAKQVIAQFIEGCPSFSKMTKYQKNGLAVLIEGVRVYDAGEVILQENSLHNGVYFIVEGSVFITVTKQDVVLAELKSGDLFGEISTFGMKTTSANVIAGNQVKIIQISLDDLSVMSMEIREKLKDIILEQILKRQVTQNSAILHFTG
ncbi:MAG: cyclic nucleotide-binding domain-containing protein [Magnetococcus sp. THC-1_WYH]